jgi:hypothetical protein
MIKVRKSSELTDKFAGSLLVLSQLLGVFVQIHDGLADTTALQTFTADHRELKTHNNLQIIF